MNSSMTESVINQLFLNNSLNLNLIHDFQKVFLTGYLKIALLKKNSQYMLLRV